MGKDKIQIMKKKHFINNLKIQHLLFIGTNTEWITFVRRSFPERRMKINAQKGFALNSILSPSGWDCVL